jgi:hypothetical protein
VRQETGKEQAVEVDCDEGVAIRSSPEDVVAQPRDYSDATVMSAGKT